MKHIFVAALCATAVSGCTTTPVIAGEPIKLEDVIRQIKKDVGEYNAYAAQHAADARLDTACRGQVDLTIKTVTVSVTTASKTNQGVTAGAELAPLAFFSKAGANAGYAVGNESTQVLTFTLEPTAAQGTQLTATPSRLYLALRNLRESLLNASDTEPCLRFPKTGQKNTLEFGFTASRKMTAGGGVNLIIFALGASASDERISAHKISIGFEGAGEAFQVE